MEWDDIQYSYGERRPCSHNLFLILELVWQPVETFVKAVATGGACCLDVPVTLAKRMKAKLVCDLGCIHCIRQILHKRKTGQTNIIHVPSFPWNARSEFWAIIIIIMIITSTITIITIINRKSNAQLTEKHRHKEACSNNILLTIWKRNFLHDST